LLPAFAGFTPANLIARIRFLALAPFTAVRALAGLGLGVSAAATSPRPSATHTTSTRRTSSMVRWYHVRVVRTQHLMLVVPLLVALVARGEAEPKKKVGKGFWKVLVKPGAKWVLHDNLGHGGDLTIETYDVRTIGKAQVARLRWTLGDDAEALKYTHAPGLTQLAVSDEGLYMMWAAWDDAKVAEALKKKPSRSDPPKPYKATQLNEGRSLSIDGDVVCMGYSPASGCESEGCDGGEVCVDSDGFTLISNVYAPGGGEYVRERRKK
jgi:hypothetical protein